MLNFYTEYCVCCGRYSTKLTYVRGGASVEVVCPVCTEEVYGEVAELHLAPEYIYTYSEADLSDDLPF